jgi:hypothetical protein
MTFGQIKSIIENNLLESYKNEQEFKKSLKEFKQNVLNNKNMSKLYSLYDQLTTPQGLTEADAKDFLEEGITLIQKLVPTIKTPKTLYENGYECLYGFTDSIFVKIPPPRTKEHLIYDIDLFLIPRVNVVNGLTDDDINKWGWQVNDNGWVMYPDYQTRLYRNHVDIKWEGKVHERIVGYKTMAPLPPEEEWSLYHIKDIDRQRKQNELYQTIVR